MLDVPGCEENIRLPNAVAVVSALKITARVRLVCNRCVVALAPSHDVVDLERDADAQQQTETR